MAESLNTDRLLKDLELKSHFLFFLFISGQAITWLSGCGDGDHKQECLYFLDRHEEYCIPREIGSECDYVSSFCKNGHWQCAEGYEHPPAPPDFAYWTKMCELPWCDAQQIPDEPREDWQDEEPYVPPDPASLTGEWRLAADSKAIVPVGCEYRPVQFAEVGSLAVDPTNPDVMYVGLRVDESGGDSWASGVFKSVDGGQTWFEARAGLGYNSDMECFGPCTHGVDVEWLFIDPDDPQVLYASTTTRGLFRTRNGARKWKYVELPYSVMRPGPVTKGPDGRYYVIEGMLSSDDNGVTWKELPQFGHAGRHVTALAFENRFPNKIWAGMGAGGSQESGEGYIFLSDDSGKSWTELGQDIDDYCQGQGQTWSISICDADPDQMAATVYWCGLFLSLDGGMNWYRSSKPVDSIITLTASYQPNPDRCRLYAADGKSGSLYWTEDGGLNWTKELDVPLDFLFFNPYLTDIIVGIMVVDKYNHAPFELWVRE